MIHTRDSSFGLRVNGPFVLALAGIEFGVINDVGNGKVVGRTTSQGNLFDGGGLRSINNVPGNSLSSTSFPFNL